jgi:hypothetical protein
MTETKRGRKRRPVTKSTPEVTRSRESDDAERALGRAVALGLPVATVLGAVVAGVVASVGSALLVLAAGALIGTIGLLWASVRTLSGDAPLAEGFEGQTSERRDVRDLLDEKRRALRALKDLESEHALGKIDDADYERVAQEYRDEAKRIMRAIDDTVAPYRERAEEVARAYLEKHGLAREAAYREPAEAAPREQDGTSAKGATDPANGEGATRAQGERIACKGCGASNELDAAFCKQCGASMGQPEMAEKNDVSA